MLHFDLLTWLIVAWFLANGGIGVWLVMRPPQRFTTPRARGRKNLRSSANMRISAKP